MKSIYYFSKYDLKFIEVSNFYKKLFGAAFLTAAIISSVIFCGYLYLGEYMLNYNNPIEIRKNNQVILSKINRSVEEFSTLSIKLDSLNEINEFLRMAVNMKPVAKEYNMLGTGGTSFRPLQSSFEGNTVFLWDSLKQTISAKIAFESNNIIDIKTRMSYNKKLISHRPSLNPMKQGVLHSNFGVRFHPIMKTYKMHTGIDLVADSGTPVLSPADGVVKVSEYQNGYGHTIEIDHGFGFTTLYAHLQKSLVNQGDKIKRGKLIALSGNSGSLTTGPHLHYEVRVNGELENPLNYIVEDTDLKHLLK